jgi:TolB-like protein
MSFWKELSRRNVVRVGIAYAVAAWLIIHPVDIIFPILHLPEWSITLVAAFLIILFPLVLIFAWAYEITPKGLKKTKEVPVSKSITHLTGKRLNYIIVGLLVIAVAYLLFDKYYINRHATETVQVPAISTAIMTKKSVVVIPFVNMSSDKEQEYFVDGLSEELLNTLAQIPNLGVIGRTSSFSFKGSNKTAQEIASILGADHILEGSVRKSGKSLRITAQLLRAKDGLHLWSKSYDRELKDIFSVQEDIAASVADELKAKLGIGKSLKQLGGTENIEAYELYLAAKGQGLSDDLNILKRTLESVDQAIALDPKFALAWALKSRIHLHFSVSPIPPGQITLEQDAAIDAAQRVINTEPKLADGYYILGELKSSRGKFIEAESLISKALESTNEQSFSVSCPYYLMVGNFKRAYEVIDAARRRDPLNQENRAFYILSLGFIGDMQQAENEYERCKILFGDLWNHGSWTIVFLRLTPDHPVTRDNIPFSNLTHDAVKDHLDSPKAGLMELRKIYANEGNLSVDTLMDISVWAAYFSDPNFAMDAAVKAFKIDTTRTFYFWLPVMKEVRQTPRFKALVKKIGLVDYWNKFGWPDICHKLDNGDFVCD